VNRIDPAEVAKRYNALKIIIDADDKWHLATEKVMSDFIHASIEIIPNFESLKILNAGSAGNSFGLKENNMIHVDVANKHIAHLPNSVVADIASLPFENNSFDLIICVGSVLNYCDPLRVIDEFQRVLKANGYLIIEFENSNLNYYLSEVLITVHFLLKLFLMHMEIKKVSGTFLRAIF
jgi:SAM-dependent methyltransferase